MELDLPVEDQVQRARGLVGGGARHQRAFAVGHDRNHDRVGGQGHDLRRGRDFQLVAHLANGDIEELVFLLVA